MCQIDLLGDEGLHQCFVLYSLNSQGKIRKHFIFQHQILFYYYSVFTLLLVHFFQAQPRLDHTMQKAYSIAKHEGIENLTLITTEIPKPKRHQLLVRIRACSLNYRDLMVIKGLYPPPYAPNLIPLSDAAGEIVELGEDVDEFAVGDRVCSLFHQAWMDGPPKDEHMNHILGGIIHGTLCQYRVFEKQGVIKFPDFMSFEEAATLPCAALTAWHSLAHNGKQHVGPDQSVLLLGTGGVSLFGMQFAAAAGAQVIVTSGHDEKIERAKKITPNAEFINYNKQKQWDQEVRKMTGGKGVDHVLEVGGIGTLQKSLKAVRREGAIHLIGVLAQLDQAFNVGLEILFTNTTVRGLLVGSKAMFEAMNKAIAQNKIHPVIDRVFKFEDAKKAYYYLETQQHIGKIVIQVE